MSAILSGVMGLADLTDPAWKANLEERRALLDSVALPGVVEQAWTPALHHPDLHDWMAAAGSTPVLIGAAGIWETDGEPVKNIVAYTDGTVDRTRAAQSAGASLALVPTPRGLRPLPGQSASALVYRYFRDTQAKSALPLVIYQPAGTPEDYRMTADGILSLTRMRRVVGLIMEDGTETEFEENIRAGRRADFTVLCGEDLFPAALEWGARGVAVPLSSLRLGLIAAEMRSRRNS